MVDRSILALLIFLVIPFAGAYGVTFYNPAWNPQDGKVFDLVEAGKVYEFDVNLGDAFLNSCDFY